LFLEPVDTEPGLRSTATGEPVNRKAVLLSLAAAAAAAAALAQLDGSRTPTSDAASRDVSRPSVAATEPSRLAALPQREPIGAPQGQLFGPRSWAPEPSPAAKAAAAAPVVEKPSAPPLPYRFGGQVVQEGGMRVVLLKGDRVYEVREGETLEDGYRLDAIQPRGLSFTYVPLGAKQELAVSGAALEIPGPRVAQAPARAQPAPAPAAPQPASPSAQPARSVEPAAAPSTAQLRFEGPQEVRAGKPFDVALKITSQQPVRAMPMQLSFDAKRLEPLSVRAGELFAGGSFTYRVNPSGSIFVGASGSGRAAANTDSLIVTFRPIASGAAELKVSSLLVQGAAGRTIAHEPPQAFRAAVVQ
jgi:hypothetical protein